MIDLPKEQLSSTLRGSFLEFCKTFYPLLTSREFIIPNPHGREPHVITIARALTRAARLETTRLIINCPPGHGKSLMLVMWVAWTMASNPDSKFLYISYSKSLSAKHTETIKRIMQLSHYKYLFGVEIRHDARGKEFFQTTHGGSVAAFGSAGAITGTDAGLPGLDRFTGACIIDDAHKPDEANSDTIRESVISNYRETIQQRARGINVPFIFIGQRLHEADLAAFLLNGEDGHTWDRVILKSIDDAGNAIYPEAFPLSMLKIRQERDVYVFASQHQQNPIPAGGSLFKEQWFIQLDDEPDIHTTFITADTAETDKTYNDATAFCFWGLYELDNGETAIHWLDGVELFVEPKDLKEEFMTFYTDCMRHPIKPRLAAIEKKSTGTTLVSVLEEVRGIDIRPIKRTKASGSKTQRFLECQPYVASKLISLPSRARHTRLCIDHMIKITANDSHKRDDLGDCLSDAIHLALIDKTLNTNTTKTNEIAAKLMQKSKSIQRLKDAAYGGFKNSSR